MAVPKMAASKIGMAVSGMLNAIQEVPRWLKREKGMNIVLTNSVMTFETVTTS